jgi:peptidoglycan hydrolase-like protein with peptidoglycan-binding domain
MKLELGQKSEQVRALQLALGLAPNGTFDQATRIAVLAWQMQRGLPNTGMVDDFMWKELGCIESTNQPKATFKKDAKDGDGDGIVQEGTIFERPKSDK